MVLHKQDDIKQYKFLHTSYDYIGAIEITLKDVLVHIRPPQSTAHTHNH